MFQMIGRQCGEPRGQRRPAAANTRATSSGVNAIASQNASTASARPSRAIAGIIVAQTRSR
jgi:hypothetical protein